MVKSPAVSVDRLVLVYDSDHGARGDFSLNLRKVFKGESCSLRAITHRLWEKPEWRETRDRLGVPVVRLYRDQLTFALRNAAAGQLPCILGETADHVAPILGPEEIAECGGSPERLECMLREHGAID